MGIYRSALLALLLVGCGQRSQEPVCATIRVPGVSVDTVYRYAYPYWIRFSDSTQIRFGKGVNSPDRLEISKPFECPDGNN